MAFPISNLIPDEIVLVLVPQSSEEDRNEKNRDAKVVFARPHLVEQEEAEEEEDFSEKMYTRSGRKDADILRTNL